MLVFQQKNQLKFKNSDIYEKVLISNTKFSKIVLNSLFPKRLHSKNNIFNYNSMLFPIKIDDYWTLLYVNFQNLKVTYFDSTQQYSNSNKICANLFKFLKTELKYHENQEIEASPLKSLAYITPNDYSNFSIKDSAVYMLIHAYKIAVNPHLEISNTLVNEYVEYLYNLLIDNFKI